MVPTKDYARQYKELKGVILEGIESCLLNDNPILGQNLRSFEGNFARYHGVRHAIGVGSGSDALTMSLQSHGIGQGDLVITCAHTFPGVLSAILRSGAQVLLLDGDPTYGLLHPEAVETHLTAHVKAIVAVHLYGHPVQGDRLRHLCDKHNLVFIEDAAQAHGARWQGMAIGNFGHSTCFSFHPSKNLGAFGDGGAVITQDKTIDEDLRVRRNLGKADKYAFEQVAANSKLDTLQATILDLKLPHLDSWVAKRQEIATHYLKHLKGIPDLKLPAVHPEASHAWHLFVIQSLKRDELRQYLLECGVKTGMHYPMAAPDHPAFASVVLGGPWPIARQWAQTCLSLPISPELSLDEINRVIAGIQSFYGVNHG